jgi:predicted RND superfamily exporter protein/lauroyl/myristoyl acyltransferase
MSRRLRPWLWLLFLVPVVLGFLRLRFDVDVLNLLPGDVPAVHGLELYQRNFTDSRDLIITVRSPTSGQTESAARSIAEVLRADTNRVASVLWQPAWMERPREAAELIGFLWLNQPPAVFGDLTNRLTGTNIAATVADTRDQLATSFSPRDLALRAYDPFNLMALPEGATSGAETSFGDGEKLFASPDGTFRVIFVKARPDLINYRACIEWLRSIKAIVRAERDRGNIPGNAVVGFTGSPAFISEISGGMQHDMTASVGITSAIIALLFWIFHRRWVPMLWLLVLLAVILTCTLAVGGLIFGAINVVSLGFAGILLGLAVDYGVVHYQEAMASPEAIIPEIRRAIGPSIFWAAVTTITAFLVLNFGGLPGLGQLGSLVALGVTLSALVMLFAFLPPLFNYRTKRRQAQIAAGTFSGDVSHHHAPDPIAPWHKTAVFVTTALLIATIPFVAVFAFPQMDQTANALRPKNSGAYAALDEIKTNLAGNREPLWLIAQGRTETEIIRRFETVRAPLEQALSNHTIHAFTLPTLLWPQAEYQSANRPAAAEILTQREALRSTLESQGFGTNSFFMTDAILNTWQAALDSPVPFWPTNEMSRWILEKVAARNTNGFLGVGFIFPNTNTPPGDATLVRLGDQLDGQGLILSSWDLLGPAILKRVQQNLWKLVVPMIVLILLSLWLAFRRFTEIFLSLSVLALSGFCLLTIMRLFGWQWNLLNLMALPLMLGSGVDYSIFMQLALRRHNGNIAAAHHAVGRALLLCGGTAIAGFGSLIISTNAGMASLGQVCAVGIAGNMLISVFLLPVWWRLLTPRRTRNETPPPAPGSAIAESNGKSSPPSAPSSFYRAGPWRFGLWMVRLLPRRVCILSGSIFVSAYWRFARERRETVIQNLLPALQNDRAAAKRKAKDLFQQFAVKIVDLWQYEAGMPIDTRLAFGAGWEHFEKSRSERRGILLLTPHLGNWEFGGPWMTKRGVQLQVITLAEPGKDFTELRQASRARWNIETIVIGNDPFAFLEIIKRLEAGATVALLVDRPPPPTAIDVKLFGQTFPASVAAAELARASGCVLLPVYVLRNGDFYASNILPPIPYDRSTLRDRAARQQLTQDIVNAFAPVIRENLDQWYHFVPLWRGEAES